MHLHLFSRKNQSLLWRGDTFFFFNPLFYPFHLKQNDELQCMFHKIYLQMKIGKYNWTHKILVTIILILKSYNIVRQRFIRLMKSRKNHLNKFITICFCLKCSTLYENYTEIRWAWTISYLVCWFYIDFDLKY